MPRISSGAGPGIVLCVGVSAEDLVEVARAVDGRVMLMAAPDTADGQALLRAAGLAVGGDGGALVPPSPVVPREHRVVEHGDLRLDLDTRHSTWETRELELPARSFDLLAALAEDFGRTWTFAELTEKVWTREYLGDTDAVISAVKRLRRHLAGQRVDLRLESVRGVGFRLADAEDPAVPQQLPHVV